ncbi:MAG: lysozyme [Burkholderiales bacterium]|nr:lysozyme [Burkholderiales bacterium]
MITSTRGIALIKQFEGCRLTAYLCPAGVATIGVGHTGSDVTLADVRHGRTITQAQADALLARDLRTTEAAVSRCVKVALTQGQFDALVSFAYNLGAGTLQRASLLASLNQGDYAGAANDLLDYVSAHVNGVRRVLPGLVARRRAEQALFNA